MNLNDIAVFIKVGEVGSSIVRLGFRRTDFAVKAGGVSTISAPAVSPAYIGVGYNTKVLPAGDVPKSFDDLLKPALKGKLAISNDDVAARMVGGPRRRAGPHGDDARPRPRIVDVAGPDGADASGGASRSLPGWTEIRSGAAEIR